MIDGQAEVIRDIELAIALSYDGGLDGGLDGVIDDAEDAALDPTLEAIAQIAASSLTKTADNIQLNTPQATDMQLYASLEYAEPETPVDTHADAVYDPLVQFLLSEGITQAVASEQQLFDEPLPPQILPDDQTPESIMAMEMLLANNGSLFNGAVAGVGGNAEDADERAAARARRERKRQAERKRTAISGISEIASDLDLDAEDYEDDYAFDEMMSMIQNAGTDTHSADGDQSDIYGAYGELGSFTTRSTRGMVS